jgi:hypothetical protein
MAQRFLRPAHIVPSGDSVWLVDESRPAAAVVTADRPPALVTWSHAAPGGYRVVVSDGVGIVVQDGGTITWVRSAGSTAELIDGVTLSAAQGDSAWLVDAQSPDPGAPGLRHTLPTPPEPPPGRILLLLRDGAHEEVETPVPVRRVELDGDDVTVVFAERPINHPAAHGGWSIEYPVSLVTLAQQDLFTTDLALVPRAAAEADELDRGRGSWIWLETEPEVVLRSGLRCGGLVWSAGTPKDGDAINRRVVLAGHDPSDTRPVVRLDLGLGIVSAMRRVGAEVWLAVERRRFLAVPHDAGVEVLAVSTSGSVRTILAADAIDISATEPPLVRPPDVDIRAHIERVRREFDHLDAYWHDQDGGTNPLSEGLSRPTVTQPGEWPDSQLVVTFRHSIRPGLWLRRTYGLFDETGQPVDHDDAAIFLMEDLDTGCIAPSSEAVDGVLDT